MGRSVNPVASVGSEELIRRRHSFVTRLHYCQWQERKHIPRWSSLSLVFMGIWHFSPHNCCVFIDPRFIPLPQDANGSDGIVAAQVQVATRHLVSRVEGSQHCRTGCVVEQLERQRQYWLIKNMEGDLLRGPGIYWLLLGFNQMAHKSFLPCSV